MSRNISKKPIIILSSLIVVLLVVTVAYVTTHSQAKQLQLENLINTPYEVLDIRRDKKEKTYEIDIEGSFNYADNILLANKLLSELKQSDEAQSLTLNMNVYEGKPTKSTKKTIDISDEAYLYTIQTDGAYVYQYEPLVATEDLDDLIYSVQWEIENQTLSDNELSFDAILPNDLTSDEILSVLQDLSDEMGRYNFDQADANVNIRSTITDSETYYFLSQYPNYLVYKTRLIG